MSVVVAVLIDNFTTATEREKEQERRVKWDNEAREDDGVRERRRNERRLGRTDGRLGWGMRVGITDIQQGEARGRPGQGEDGEDGEKEIAERRKEWEKRGEIKDRDRDRDSVSERVSEWVSGEWVSE
jgi:hypothetical protein